MRTETDFLAQVKLAKAALQQFVYVTTTKEFEDADPIKRGAMENLMKHTVRTLHYFSLFYL